MSDRLILVTVALLGAAVGFLVSEAVGPSESECMSCVSQINHSRSLCEFWGGELLLEISPLNSNVCVWGCEVE